MPRGEPTRRVPSPGSSAATISRCRWSTWRPGSCRDGLHPDRANENRGGESVLSYLLGLAEIRQLALRERRSARSVRRSRSCVLEPRETPLERAEDALSQVTFLNRQALYLRPDPARVVVRPFKPATEPRDLNPTDKTRANHIVDRVLALDPEAAASQLADVLENFQGRHRNLLATLRGARRRDGRRLRAACGLHQDAAPAGRRLFPARVFLRGVGLVQSEHRLASGSVRRAGRRASLHPESSRGRRRACFLPDVSLRDASRPTAA